MGITLPSRSAVQASFALALWLGTINHVDKLRKLASVAWLLSHPALPGEGEDLDKHFEYAEERERGCGSQG